MCVCMCVCMYVFVCACGIDGGWALMGIYGVCVIYEYCMRCAHEESVGIVLCML